jgi:hypothetical protein
VRRVARLAVAVTIAAPGWSVAISDQDVEHWRRASGGEAKALSFLIDATWTRGEASERGIAVSANEAREAIYRRPHDGLDRSDLAYEARTRLLATKIRDQIGQPAAQSVTPEQIEAYVQTHPRMEPELRVTRLVVTANRAKARAARRALQRGLTWQSVVRRYTSPVDLASPVTVEPRLLPKRLERAVYAAPRDALTRYGQYVFKVIKIIPSEPTPLDQQRATAWEILSSEAQAGAINAFRAEFRSRWRLRTTCAPAYKTHPDCSNPPTVE